MTYKLKKIGLLFLLITILGMTNCYYDIAEELYPPDGCNTAAITYSQIVLPIIQTNCYGCHEAVVKNGGVDLEGYTALKIYVDNGKLLGSIKHLNGFSAMPQNASKLLDCDIKKIETWIEDGAVNN